MATITTISVKADVSRDCVAYIRDALKADHPKASVSVKPSRDYALRCEIESDKNDTAFNVDAPMIERQLADQVNRLVNFYNS